MNHKVLNEITLFGLDDQIEINLQAYSKKNCNIFFVVNDFKYYLDNTNYGNVKKYHFTDDKRFCLYFKFDYACQVVADLEKVFPGFRFQVEFVK